MNKWMNLKTIIWYLILYGRYMVTKIECKAWKLYNQIQPCYRLGAKLNFIKKIYLYNYEGV